MAGGAASKSEATPSAGGVGLEAARIGNALQRLLDDGDRVLSTSPVVLQAAAYTGMRPSVLAASLVGLLVLTLGFGFGGGLVCDVAGFLYPGEFLRESLRESHARLLAAGPALRRADPQAASLRLLSC